MQLSPNYSLEDLTRSQTAARKGIENVPNAGEIANLERLCETLLEPAIWLLGTNLHINSGYRSPALNAAVGGAKGSAHMDGRAADVVPAGLSVQAAFKQIAASALPFDQLILECGTWLHLSIAKVGVDPRREVLVAEGGPGKWTYRRVA